MLEVSDGFCGKRDGAGQRVCVLPKGHSGPHEDNHGRELDTPNIRPVEIEKEKVA